MKKVAILGGGMASLTAAYWLTSQPGWETQYEVTVHQMGWRLGGKAACGRNQGASQRTEEHGFHMLFGFYENTFATMRGCYGELGRGPDEPLAEFCATDPADEERFPDRYAVKRNSLLFLAQRFGDGFETMRFDFPTNGTTPGEGLDCDLWTAFTEMARWLRHFGTLPAYARAPGPSAPPSPGILDKLEQLSVAAAAEAWAFGVDEVESHPSLLALLGKALDALPPGPRAHLDADYERATSLVLTLVKLYLEWLWIDVKDHLETDWTALRAWILQDFVGTNVIGFLQDNVLLNGFDSLNGQNYYAWLMRHASVPEGSRVTIGSVLVQFAYNACFAFRGGDAVSPPTPDKPMSGMPDMEAGTMLRGGMRLFLTYKGAVDWLFQAGCGDALSAPMYQVLSRRGVKFEFFSKVLGLGLSTHGTAIDTLRMERQVTLRDGDYDPLIVVKGLPSWPSEPLYEQIVEGAALEAQGVDLESAWTAWKGAGRTLRRGEDFDLVLLGISVAALPGLCGELVEASDAWRQMLASVQTTRTFGFQTWLNKSEEELGATQGHIRSDTGAEPCGMEAEATQVVAREAWPAGSTPANLTYFGGVMKDDPAEPAAPDPAYAETQAALIEREAIDFLDHYAGIYWPRSVGPDGFAWEILVDPENPGTAGPERFRSQFWKANIDPTERYVLSVVDSTQRRLTAGDSGFSNLYVTGDWIKTSLSCGCMEATVMSGMEASQAICGHPASVHGEDGFSGRKRGEAR